MNKSKTQNQKQPKHEKKQKTHTKIQTLSFFLSSINNIIIITHRLLLDRRRARHTIVVTRIACMLGPQVQIGGGSCPGDRRTGRVSTTATATATATTTAATGNTTIGAGAGATATATATDDPSAALLDHARHFVHVSRITCAAGPPSGTAVSAAPTTVAPAGPRGAAAAAAAATAAPRAVPGLARPVAAPAPVRIAPPSPPLPQTLLAAASCVR
jgi:hypothetical protein